MLARTSLVISILGLIAVAAWAMFAASADKEDGFLQWRDPAVTSAGQTLYRTHCSACHGMPDGSTPPVAHASEKPAPPHDATGHTWQHPDFALFQLIRDGIAVANCTPVDPQFMPTFRGIVSDAELVAILSYIKSSWPEDIRLNHNRVNILYGAYNEAVGKMIDMNLDDPER